MITLADELVAVSASINANAGLADDAPAGLLFITDVTVKESVSAAAKATNEKVPAVVESEAAPVNPAVPAVVEIVA
jgi:hypothetical protein